ncbi:MAG: TIGR02680 family protein [Euzebya sp.]
MKSASPQLHPDLPQPGNGRWQPLRIGLVELFHYDTEEFWFRDGNLLLRGNNGTGKSKVLALTLPFLLDGDASPHRVEPDGDAKKRMDWNLLLGGRYDDRTGYAWVEFGRVDDETGPMFLTLACGMRASAGKGVADKWFVVSHRRMGEGLHLVDHSQIVLGKDRVRGVLGEGGTVFERAEDYRRVVNQHLFGLSQQRYDALLTLLVQLRQPQLSKRPNMTALNAALTEALPPLPAAVITDVAEAMRTLERERQGLADLQQARDAVGRFGGDYASYATIATLRRADDVRRTTRVYEDTGRELGTVQRAREEAADQVGSLTRQETALRDRVRALAAREQTLRQSPEMRDAARLDQARVRAAETTDLAQQAADRLVKASERLSTSRRRRTEAAAKHDEVSGVVESERGGAVRVADESGLAAGSPDGDALVHALAPPGDRSTSAAVIRRRSAALDHVTRLTVIAAEATRGHAAALSFLDTVTTARDSADEAHAVALEGLSQAGAEWVAGLGEAASSWTVLSPGPAVDAGTFGLPRALDAALDAAAQWAAMVAGPNPFEVFAQRLARAADAGIARERTSVVAQAEQIDQQRQALQDQLSQLEEGTQAGPEPSATRMSASRDARPGAPLWQLLDFAPQVTAADRAGLEAALEGAGLLDAWVTPEGGLLEPDTLDTAIVIGEAPANPSAAGVLQATSEDAAVPTLVIQQILARVGLGEGSGHTWVDVAGRYRVGTTRGVWRKAEASFIGWAARDAARLRRISVIQADLAELSAAAAVLTQQILALDLRAEQVATDLAAVPEPQEVREAASRLTAARARLDDAEQAVQQATAEVERAATTALTATTTRDEMAVELGVAPDPEGQQRLRDSLAELREVLAGLWPRLEQLDQAAQALGQAQRDSESDTAATESARADSVAADAARDQATATYQTLSEMVGESVERVVAALQETEQERRQVTVEADDRRDRVITAAEKRARADGQVELLSARLEVERDTRAAAVEALRLLAGTGLVQAAADGAGQALEIPDPDQTWAADPGVHLARDLRRVLPDADAGDEAWDRAGSTIHASFGDLERTLAAQGARTWQEVRHGVIVVGVNFSGQDFGVHRLGGVLEERLEDHRRLLDAREQQILEDHLITDVAAQLSQLIGDAERQVARMNTELEQRPNSTGMRLRLRWKPDPDEGPAGLEQALGRLLRQSSGAWSEDDRQALGQFLQAEIQRRRSENDAGTWTEHLTKAFDYRQWHRFVVQVKKGGGTWQRADGPASGGERVLAVTVPLFAAASAHYSSAADHAPRLVLLDEAFAGVDDRSRRQCLGLLDTFDLDYVLTSEREWGCYPEVPGLSICHLVRRPDVDAVHVSRWEWNGTTPQPATRPHDSAREPATVPAGGGLFDEVG